jgi:hypothetical protein
MHWIITLFLYFSGGILGKDSVTANAKIQHARNDTIIFLQSNSIHYIQRRILQYDHSIGDFSMEYPAIQEFYRQLSVHLTAPHE